MLKALANYILNGKINQQSVKLKRGFVEWNEIQSVVILMSSEQYKDPILKKIINAIDKKAEIIVSYNDKTSVCKDCFLSINKKDINFLGLPNAELSERLKDKKCDVFINADFKDTLLMKAVTGLIQGKCKVGREGLSYGDLFDISIVLKGDSGLESYLVEAANYLKMIKTK